MLKLPLSKFDKTQHLPVTLSIETKEFTFYITQNRQP